MSRFYNDTHKVQSDAAVSIQGDSIDLQGLVDRLRARVEPQRAIADHYREPSSPVDSDVLGNCRTFRLSNNAEKTFLAIQRSGDMPAAEAYRTLRTRLSKLQTQNGATLIDVTGTAKGEGKTLTALNLALCYSQLQDSRVLLVDADLRTKGLSVMLDLDQSPGLSNILEMPCSYESAIARMDESNLFVLSAGTSLMPPPELLSRSTWKEFARWARKTFQIIVVDSPPALDLADFELIADACDGIVLVARAGKTKRQSLGKVLEQLDRKKLLGVVLNDAAETPAKGYYYYNQTTKRPGTGERS